MSRKTLTIAEFHEALNAQGVKRMEDLAFICPVCKTRQTGQDLIDAGAGSTFAEVEGFVGFSCVGRWTGAGPPREQPDGKPCDWTLGGLFKIHTLEVLDVDGRRHPRFEVAT